MEKDLDEELRFHVDQYADDLTLSGVERHEARRRARAEFGAVEARKEECREALGLRLVDEVRQDLRFAISQLRRSPGFTLVVATTLSLGIAANTTIFSVVNSVLLKPLPYENSDTLVRLMMSLGAADSPTHEPLRTAVALSAAEVADLQSQTRALSYMATAGPELMGLSGYEEAARLQGARVSASTFDMLGIRPLLGRVFSVYDQSPGAAPVMLISASAWQQYWGGDPEIVGHVLTLDSVLGPRRQTQYTVIGVLPAAFEYPRPRTQFWMPFQTSSPGSSGIVRGPMVGRLADGVSLAAASAEIGPLIRRIRLGRPGNAAATYELIREQDELVAPVKSALVVLMIAVACVLLIACVNVANLLLARSATREREIAIRTAVGAGRGRLIRQLFTESMLLAAMGGVIGIALAFGGVNGLRALAATLARFDLGNSLDFPRLNDIRLDSAAMVFTIAVSVVTGVLFGLAPAAHHARVSITAALREVPRAHASRWGALNGVALRKLLVVAEVGIATVLLVTSSLLIRSFLNLSAIDTGYNPSNVLTFQVALPLDRYPDARLKPFAEELVGRLQSVPGVKAAGYGNQLPMVNLVNRFPLRRTLAVANIQPPPPGTPDARLVSRDYLKAMEIPVLAGRGFIEGDRSGAPRVLLVNDVLARRDFPGQNPIGQTVYVGPDATPWEVVGIVGNIREFSLDQEPEPQFFADLRQWPAASVQFPVGAYYAVRTAGDPTAIVNAIRGAVRQVDPAAALFNVAPMEQLVSNSVAQPRMYAVLLGIFGGIGLTLALVGIYGVMAYSVTQRTHEIGIRIAVGAPRRDVIRLVLREGTVLTCTGIGLGLGVAAVLSRYLRSLLFRLEPLSAETFVGVATVFALVAILAAYVPARRATRIDPLAALRAE